MIIGGVCLIAVIVLAFIDMVTNAVRCPLLLLNLLLWFVGVFFMLAGALFLLESWEFEEDERILENLDFPGTLLSHLEVLLFSFGLALFTVSSCGCVGALRENTFLLNMYSHALTFLILINFVLGVLVFFVPGSIRVVIRATLSERLVVQYRDVPDIENLVDALQRYLNSYFHCNLSNPSHERCSVPPSCCRADSSYTGIFCGRDVLNLSDHEAWFRVHTGSCPDAANRFLKEHVMIIGGVCLIAVIVLAFIDMVTNAVIDEIDIIRKLYDNRFITQEVIERHWFARQQQRLLAAKALRRDFGRPKRRGFIRKGTWL
ncbi:tetraspanin-33 [Rhipicephalus microplus]|uniref:tetraspanin-33 n=1 Tax=Rhipicephalus microplus TaxID=6941 RepID=UPI003F6B05FE